MVKFFLQEKFQKKVAEKFKTCILDSKFKKNCAVYEIMWKNMAEPIRPQLTI
jgi:hypothetical protein